MGIGGAFIHKKTAPL